MMMKNTALLALMILATSCFHGSSGTRNVSVDESAVDTVWYVRSWKDPLTAVLERPSEEKIAEWKRLCETYDAGCNRFAVEAGCTPVESYVAFSDLDMVRYQHGESGLRDDFRFMCWRLNELCPVVCGAGECARYDALQVQLDSLCSYGPGPMAEISNMASTVADFHFMRAQYYGQLLRSLLQDCSALLEKEHEAFVRYASVSQDAFERIVLGDSYYWGTIIPLCMAGFRQMIAGQYDCAVVPVYLHITDPEHFTGPERHGRVSQAAIDDAYRLFRDSMKEEDNPDDEHETPQENTLEGRMRILDEDRHAWMDWMSCRAEVSSKLEGPLKDVYDACTNNAMRGKLVTLLNRYTENDVASDSYFEILLRPECTDAELEAYDYDRAYQAYLEN